MKSLRIVAICLFFLWTVASLSAVIAQPDESEPEPLSLTETETFNIAVGAVTVSYPEGWELIPRAWEFIDDSLQVIEFSNVPGFDVRTAHEDDVSIEGVIFGSIYVFKHENQTLDEIALLLEDQNIVDRERFTIDDREGLTLWLEPSEGIAGESTTMILDDEYIVEIYTDALPDVRDAYRPTLREMIATVSVDALNSEPVVDIDLPQTITLEDGSSIDYPEGWVAEEVFGRFFLASNRSLLDQLLRGDDLEGFNSGDVFVTVFALPWSSSEASAMRGRLVDFVNQVVADMNLSGEATELTIGGQEAASISGTSTDGIETGGYLLVVNDADAGFLIFAVAVTAPGEQESINTIVNAIASSFRIADQQSQD